MLDRIVEYFKEKYNVNVKVSQSAVYRGDFILEVETKLTESELDEFSDFLKNLGFLPRETFEYQATRKYYGYKEFRPIDDSVVLTVYYKKVKENNRIIFYVKEIEVRVNPYLSSHRIFP